MAGGQLRADGQGNVECRTDARGVWGVPPKSFKVFKRKADPYKAISAPGIACPSQSMTASNCVARQGGGSGRPWHHLEFMIRLAGGLGHFQLITKWRVDPGASFSTTTKQSVPLQASTVAAPHPTLFRFPRPPADLYLRCPSARHPIPHHQFTPPAPWCLGPAVLRKADRGMLRHRTVRQCDAAVYEG